MDKQEIMFASFAAINHNSPMSNSILNLQQPSNKPYYPAFLPALVTLSHMKLSSQFQAVLVGVDG